MTVPGKTIGRIVNNADIFNTMLERGGWLATLPETVRQAVLESSSIRTIEPGGSLFEQDGPPTGLHGVFSGEIRVIAHSREGRAVIMGVIRPGEWVGFLSCLDGLPHVYSGVARHGATTLSLSQADIVKIFERDVATYRLLLAPELAAERKLHQFMIEGIGLPLIQRVAARLCDLGRWPYGPDAGPISSLDYISQEELAMSVGATRPRINEILRELAKRGMVELGYGRIVVRDITALEQFARGE